MLNDKIQKQEGGENSSNFQGQTVNVYSGITYKDAKEIALDIFASNFLLLKNEAAEVARSRAEEITEKFLEKLNDKSPEALNEFKQPALQDALFTVQKDYAKSGDKELGDLLLDILVDRANVSVRNMMQLVLDEALKIAPRLTVEQLDTITLNFLLTQSKRSGIRNLEDFKNYVIEVIMPFADNLSKDRIDYNYIEYLGCGHVRAGGYGDLGAMMLRNYKAIFQKGYAKDDFETEVGSIEEYSDFIIPCFHDGNKFQMNRIDDSEFDISMVEKGLDEVKQGKIRGINNKYTMSQVEVRDYIASIDARMNKVFDIWTESPFNQMELTSVGFAIAHANYRRKTGTTIDLSQWIK